MGQRLIITEEERNHIRGKYGLINESDFFGGGKIPNPKKTITVPLPIEKVKEILNYFLPILNEKNSGYQLWDKSEFLNQWTFSKLETLSLGVYIDVTLEEVSENKTNVEIEVRRKMGSFDSGVEVTRAMDHIQRILKSIEEAANPENLERAKSKIIPHSIEGMGMTFKQWHDLGRPMNIELIHRNGYKSYQEWVDAGKPKLKTNYEFEKEKKDKEMADRIARGEKPLSFWEKLFK